jgi:hypothetical protein
MTDPTISRSAGLWPGRYGRGRATVLLGVVAAAAITAAGCSSPSPRSQPTAATGAAPAAGGTSASASGSAAGGSPAAAGASATATPPAASSPSAVPQGPCPSAKATYASCGFPTARNTGWAAAGTTSLKNVTSPGPTGIGSPYSTEIRTNGAVISGINLTGSIDVYANNVTIKNCRITTRNWFGINQRNGHSGLKVFNCTIIGVPGKGLDHGGEDYGISDDGGQMEVAHNNIYGFGEGITSGQGYFHDNYVHSLQSYIPIGSKSYQHTNALIDSGGSGIRVVHNTFLNWMPPRAGGSSSLMLAYDSAPVTHATIQDNWLAGGAYCLYPGGVTGSNNIVITGNFFSTEFFPGCGYYGLNAATHWHYGHGDVWRKNVWANGRQAGRPVTP